MNTTRRFLLTLALLLPSLAFGADLPAPLATVDAALDEALSAMLAKDSIATKEYATAIIETPAGFIYAPIVQGDDDRFTLKVSLHKTDRIVALLHTHPGNGDKNHVFSGPDIEMADALNVPSYIYIVETSQVKVYATGKDRVSTLNGRLVGSKMSPGRVVSLVKSL